jgi:hypothetical protein
MNNKAIIIGAGPAGLTVKKKVIIEIISVLLILLFVYAAVSKLLDYSTFKVQLGKSPFISSFSSLISWMLPTIEIIVGILLSMERTRALGLFASLFLLSMFTSYIYIILHYSYYIPCSCGGILEKMGWSTHFWFNLSFIAITITGLFLE